MEKRELTPEQIAKASEIISNIAKEYSEIGKGLVDNLTAAVNSVVEFTIKIQPQLQAFVKNVSQLPFDLIEVHEALAERGWFIHPELSFPEMKRLQAHIKAENFSEVDQIMKDWIEAYFDETEQLLCDQFSDRRGFIKEGFNSHRESRYASAIIMLLTQGDGICYDVLGKIFFSINRFTEKPIAKDAIDELGVDALTQIILHPLLIKSGINATDKQIAAGEFSDSPHRNPILHGKDKTYATEVNSLKIISFVTFIGSELHRVVKEAKEAMASVVPPKA